MKLSFALGLIVAAVSSAAAFANPTSRVYDDPAPGGENGYTVTVDGARAVVSDVRNSVAFALTRPGAYSVEFAEPAHFVRR